MFSRNEGLALLLIFMGCGTIDRTADYTQRSAGRLLKFSKAITESRITRAGRRRFG